MSTVAGRALLPDAYPRADVTHNLSRAALLVAALTARRYDLLAVAMQDRLHQPYRQALFPAMPDIIQAAVDAGAHGASLSGGGSSLIALASANFTGILRAMQEAARAAGVEGTGRILRADQQGARVLPVDRARRLKQPDPNYRYHSTALN
jgi:homoserine kinase